MQKEVLILSSIDWNFQWQSKQIFATHFARAGWKVVFVNSTGVKRLSGTAFKKIISRLIKNKNKMNNPVEEGIDIIGQLILPPSNSFFMRINRKIFIPEIVRKIKKTNIKNPVVISYIPTQTTLDILDELEYSFLIYHCTDNLEAYPGIVRNFPETESELIRRSDVVITTSPYLFNKMKSRHPRVHLILPGVEYELFSRADSGPFKKLKRICYFGGIHRSRINLPMVFSVARENPDIEFIFIGPLRTKVKAKPDNIKFLPPININKLPEKLRDCDCIIFPYLENEFTKGIIPVKLFQSMATGKPIIATGINENLKNYSDVIYLANSQEEFSHFIRNLSELESREKYEKRKRIARENSWEKRFHTFLNVILESFTF